MVQVDNADYSFINNQYLPFPLGRNRFNVSKISPLNWAVELC